MSKRMSIALIIGWCLSVTCAIAQDDWLGGTGNWSNAGNWSDGLPGLATDVAIHSGGIDLVYLDINPDINSLTLGGTSGGSELSDNGITHTLKVANTMSMSPHGYLYLIGGSTVVVGGDLMSSGEMYLSGGSKVMVGGDLMSSGEMYLSGGSKVMVGGDLMSSGEMYLSGGSKVMVGGDLMSSALMYISGGSQVSVNGSLDDSQGFIELYPGSTVAINGDMSSGRIQALGGTLNVAGTLTGTQNQYQEFDGASLTAGALVNYGNMSFTTNAVYIAGAITNNKSATLDFGSNGTTNVSSIDNRGTLTVGNVNLTNQPNGITDVVQGSALNIYGNFTAGNNSAIYRLANVEGSILIDRTLATTITPGSGSLNVGPLGEFAILSPVTVNGSLDNAGEVISFPSALDVQGNFTNELSGYLWEFIFQDSFGVLTVDGAVDLSGTLFIPREFDVPIGTTYKFLLFTPGELSGKFATVFGNVRRGT